MLSILLLLLLYVNIPLHTAEAGPNASCTADYGIPDLPASLINVSLLALNQSVCSAVLPSCLSIGSCDYVKSLFHIEAACSMIDSSMISSDLCIALCVTNFCYKLHKHLNNGDIYYITCVGQYITYSKQYVPTMYGYINQCIELQCHYGLTQGDEEAEGFLEILACCIRTFVSTCFASDDITISNVQECLGAPYDLCQQLSSDVLQCDKSISYIIADSLVDLCYDNVEECVELLQEVLKEGYYDLTELVIFQSILSTFKNIDIEMFLSSYDQVLDLLYQQESTVSGIFDNMHGKAFMNLTNSLLDIDRITKLLNSSSLYTAGPSIIEDIEELSQLLCKSVLSRQGNINQTFTYKSNNIMYTMRPYQNANYVYNVTAGNTTMAITIPNNAVCYTTINDYEYNGGKSNYDDGGKCFIDPNCEVMIASSLSLNINKLLEVYLTNRSVITPILTSQLVSNSSTTSQSTSLLANATIIVTLPNNINMSLATCEFWNTSSNNWSREGVITRVLSVNERKVECITNHLTSFAVIVDHAGILQDINTIELKALTVVGYIGPSISIVCLVLTIVLLISFRKQLNKGPLLYVHLNLSIALLLALVVLVCGIETAVKIKWLCGVIAGVLHYLFLCVFCWMLAEGMMLYLLLVRVFGGLADKWYLFLPFGWGTPVIIVAVSAGIRSELYGTASFCWLSTSKGMTWALGGPMIAIILINTVILVCTIAQLVKVRKSGGAEQNVTTYDLVKSAVRGIIILLPLLGITWIVGVFALSQRTTVFLWLFTILNSLQGVAILFFHVLKNDVIWKQLRRCLVGRKARKYSETKECTSPVHKAAETVTFESEH